MDVFLECNFCALKKPSLEVIVASLWLIVLGPPTGVAVELNLPAKKDPLVEFMCALIIALVSPGWSVEATSDMKEVAV